MKKSKSHYERRRSFNERAPDPKIMRACKQGKIVYQSERVALMQAALAMKHSGAVLFAYKCPYCHGWHLTSQPQR
jgi:cytochrome c5